MRSAVDHRARKRRIIEKSIRLFARTGYREVTFQMISVQCGVARTQLYRYFRDKRQIFDAAINEVLQRIVRRHAEIMHGHAPALSRLRQICTVVTATLFDNREFLAVIIDFVMSMKRDGYDMSRRIPRFTVGLRRIMHFLLAEGAHRGEIRADANPDVVTDLLYAQFESAVLRLVVSDDAVQTDVLDRIETVLKGITA